LYNFSIRVEESLSNVTLTIERTRGAFGVVSVYCYAQNAVSETGQTGAVRGEDFFFVAKVSCHGKMSLLEDILIILLEVIPYTCMVEPQYIILFF
jgi:hypothetical protein